MKGGDGDEHHDLLMASPFVPRDANLYKSTAHPRPLGLVQEETLFHEEKEGSLLVAKSFRTTSEEEDVDKIKKNGERKIKHRNAVEDYRSVKYEVREKRNVQTIFGAAAKWNGGNSWSTGRKVDGRVDNEFPELNDASLWVFPPDGYELLEQNFINVFLRSDWINNS